MKRFLIAATGLALTIVNAQADTLIHAGRLIDGDSDRAMTEMTVRINGSSITGIDRGYTPAGSGDTVIDLRNHTVMPGLMDMHVHLTGEYSNDSRLRGFVTNEADYAFMSTTYAKRTLEAGFTTVRNVGDAFNVTIALKKAIQRGDVVGPNIFTAAKGLASTGGHGDPTNGWASHIMGDPGPHQGVVNSPADARKAVRQRYKDGADWIKITATGGVLSVAKSGQNPQFTDEELKEIVDTARDYGMRVAAHAHGTEGMRRAVVAGVASIEHGTYMDDEVRRLMKKNGTYFVPTIMAGAWVAEKAKIDGFFPELVRPKAAAIGPLMLDTFSKAYKAGVPIVFGTDTGVSPHGDNAQEFGLMVAGGMPAMEAIQSATSVAADFLGIGDTHGRLQNGKTADIVAVPGNPLDDISSMERVSFVMKNGVVHKQP
ncbi:metal-dependent hydrolase family protein [Woeseia oceani]|uniref:Amidohydrolase n=1 Tax=Woeseia oceani TaxID=1548547 RepID=A0A193LDX1_9GAMM|nr:amidohydrolase family protein [Woeseia oceani]ANO50707.1 amidohydrolase [Woeseia oceani]